MYTVTVLHVHRFKHELKRLDWTAHTHPFNLATPHIRWHHRIDIYRSDFLPTPSRPNQTKSQKCSGVANIRLLELNCVSSELSPTIQIAIHGYVESGGDVEGLTSCREIASRDSLLWM